MECRDTHAVVLGWEGKGGAVVASAVGEEDMFWDIFVLLGGWVVGAICWRLADVKCLEEVDEVARTDDSASGV